MCQTSVTQKIFLNICICFLSSARQTLYNSTNVLYSACFNVINVQCMLVRFDHSEKFTLLIQLVSCTKIKCISQYEAVSEKLTKFAFETISNAAVAKQLLNRFYEHLAEGVGFFTEM